MTLSVIQKESWMALWQWTVNWKESGRKQSHWNLINHPGGNLEREQQQQQQQQQLQSGYCQSQDSNQAHLPNTCQQLNQLDQFDEYMPIITIYKIWNYES